NLMATHVSGKPALKLLDMGLARLSQQGETGLTQSGQVLGAPDYLGPEQAFDSRKADARSDVYSLGWTLDFLLTGCARVSGGTPTRTSDSPQVGASGPRGARGPDAPPALQAVLRRMMPKPPDARYQTAAEAAEAVAPFARGEGGEMPPPPPPPPVAGRFE